MSGDLDIRVEFDLPPYLRALNHLGKNQLPFAVASTLTAVAKVAQANVKRVLPRRFKLRSTWVQRGIRIKPARKSDWPRSYALVGSRDPYMVDQETGGQRRARRGKYRAIPAKRVQRKASGAVRRAQSPRSIIGKGRGYFGDRAILLKDTRRTKHRAKTMYLLRRTVSIRPRFGFEDTVQQTAARRIIPIFRRKLTAALRSRTGA